MALRNAQPYAFKPAGLSDTADGTNAFPGAMQQLSNLIPAPDTENAFVCRPAALQKTNFPGLNALNVTGYLVLGDLVYGLYSDGSGFDQPFVYDLSVSAFEAVGGLIQANLPVSPPAAGPWTPPTLAVIGQRIVVTHPGFNGTTQKIGWFDISSFVDVFALTLNSTVTATAASSVILRGWRVGMFINGNGLPGNTQISAISADGKTITLSSAALASGATTAMVTGGTAKAPIWGSGDTLINPLVAVPVAVAQMNGRAFYAVGNAVVLSDSLDSDVVTVASQVLTFGNGLPVTALGPLGLESPLTGGIVQAIICFQSNVSIQQITGDPTLDNLAKNEIKAQTGTLAPLSLVPTTTGLHFMSPEGARLVSLTGQVSEPIGREGQGVVVPFMNAVQPSRICAAGNADTLRFTVQNGAKPGTPYEEYWLDIHNGRWTGPHSLPAALIQPWRASFLLCPVATPNTLYQSDSLPTASSTYAENGQQLTYSYKTALLPDNGQGTENRLSRTTLACALPQGTQLTILATDEAGSVLDQVFAPSAAAQAVWGGFNWGSGVWGRNISAFMQRSIPWNLPLVFKQVSIQIIGVSGANVKIGNIYASVQPLGYTVGG